MRANHSVEMIRQWKRAQWAVFELFATGHFRVVANVAQPSIVVSVTGGRLSVRVVEPLGGVDLENLPGVDVLVAMGTDPSTGEGS